MDDRVLQVSMRKLLVASSLVIIVTVVTYAAVTRSRAGSGSGACCPAAAGQRTTLDPALFQGDVHQAYVAAERYPGILIQLHCYCGCDREIGHRSLLDCYRDRHATTCPICLGEALMAGRMTYEGKPIDQIREAIRARYAHGS